jgi:hypothetical protein
MGLTTLQGLPVLSLLLTRPIMTGWAASLEVDYQDSQELFEGLLELKDERIAYKGTALHIGIVSGVARIALAGGRGGLIKELPAAQHFRDVTVRTLVQALLGAAGETLDATSTREVLDRRVAFWSFAKERASLALSTLADRLSVRWRVLPNGNVWFGTDAYPEIDDAIDATLLELDRDDAAGNVLLATETLELGPGVTLSGRRVGRVEHTFGRSESQRATFWTDT